ncbi:hypothetical protein ADL03_16020 [Nocardia sp. NRRL S-836]|nr:hypothetical protein ADL03_16020 [Nocardia sp. NRRL S-836]
MPGRKLAGLIPELVLLTHSGDVCRWTGGPRIDVYTDPDDWQADSTPTVSIAVPDGKPFQPDQFLSLLNDWVLVWKPEDDGNEYAQSRCRTRPSLTSAGYELAPVGNGYTLAVLHYRRDTLDDRHMLSAYTSRAAAVADAQHWETSRHLGHDCDCP